MQLVMIFQHLVCSHGGSNNLAVTFIQTHIIENSHYFEGGDLNRDASYFKLNPITLTRANYSTVVYVSTSDFPEFLSTFLKLSATSKIILLTGLEDIGVPWELWGMREAILTNYGIRQLMGSHLSHFGILY
jgi:hypothetical protein